LAPLITRTTTMLAACGQAAILRQSRTNCQTICRPLVLSFCLSVRMAAGPPPREAPSLGLGRVSPPRRDRARFLAGCKPVTTRARPVTLAAR
jgi:hypothetical protein